MMSSEINLEQIAKEISPSLQMKETSYDKRNRYTFHGFKADDSIKGSGKSYTTQQRFGEVLQAFLECGTVSAVAKKTGLTHYLLNKYFFSNTEFCNLLKGTNEAIFLEATKEIRDTQKGFVQKAQMLAEEALDELERLLHESESDHIKFKVAQDLLDRDPRLSRTKRIEGSGATIKLESNVLILAAQAAREIEVRDITPKENEK